jgi:hypothetical protein
MVFWWFGFVVLWSGHPELAEGSLIAELENTWKLSKNKNNNF